MIASLRGTVLVRRPDAVVIECAGVGYRVAVSAHTDQQHDANHGDGDHTTSGEHEYGTPICHHTASAENPYVLLRVSQEALHAHLLHHGDIIPAPVQGCPHH